jgi:hypothetical protein
LDDFIDWFLSSLKLCVKWFVFFNFFKHFHPDLKPSILVIPKLSCNTSKPTVTVGARVKYSLNVRSKMMRYLGGVMRLVKHKKGQHSAFFGDF